MEENLSCSAAPSLFIYFGWLNNIFIYSLCSLPSKEINKTDFVSDAVKSALTMLEFSVGETCVYLYIYASFIILYIA